MYLFILSSLLSFAASAFWILLSPKLIELIFLKTLVNFIRKSMPFSSFIFYISRLKPPCCSSNYSFSESKSLSSSMAAWDFLELLSESLSDSVLNSEFSDILCSEKAYLFENTPVLDSSVLSSCNEGRRWVFLVGSTNRFGLYSELTLLGYFWIMPFLGGPISLSSHSENSLIV